MIEAQEKQRARCLCLDIETARQDRTILREVGAFRPDTGARARISGKAGGLVSQLDELTQGAAFVLGHNVIAFDQPVLAVLHPDLALLRLPLVDTLELSPVAFPQNPYHRLVKDYKLCTTTRNDPVRDAELAYALFLDQGEALQKRVERNWVMPGKYFGRIVGRSCCSLHQSQAGSEHGTSRSMAMISRVFG